MELVGPAVHTRVAAIGECMLEVADLGGNQARLGFGGDTLNTALYLSRLGVAVDYHSALGDDVSSAQMLAAWRAEGLGTDYVEIVPGARPGLYLIRTDADGERSFQFWREYSPARRLCALPRWSQRASALRGYDWLYFSAITLSILDASGRIALLDALAAARRAGARIAFDSNYRESGWPDAANARAAIDAAWGLTDVALPTFGDEVMLHGDRTPADTIARLRAAGVGVIALKLGADGCVLVVPGQPPQQVSAPPVLDVVDTTAAGDAFNAGFLAALIAGVDAVAAARLGHYVAGAVIRHPGAIVPRHAMPGAAHAA
ncbi:MAG TPA: sugar kinase [Lysobacter sp.]